MKVFIGQTRSRALIARLESLGFGEITQRHEWPPRRRPWVLDNGAFSDWRSGQPFDAEAFGSACAWAAVQPESERPLWAVCPDRVATGLDSLAFSLDWLDKHAADYPDLRWYLAVQNGMTEGDVAPVLPRFAGLFVGGDLPWKIRTGEAWVRFAHRSGIPCHVGRVGTAKRVRWAKRIGADSIDSCLPLFSDDNLRVFLAALDARQMELL